MPKEHPHNTSLDQALVKQILKGSELAFSQLFDKYWQSMLDAAIKLLKDEESAQDVVQDVFIELWKKRQSLSIDNIAAYLHQSVRYKVIDHIRKRKIPLSNLDYVDQFMSGNFTEDWLNYDELDSVVQSTINQLPDQCRLIFRMSRFEELSNKEIADQLDISVRTVENHISKALKYLRPRLDTTLSALLLFYL